MEKFLFIFAGIWLVGQLFGVAAQVTYVSNACDPLLSNQTSDSLDERQSNLYMFLFNDLASESYNVKFYNATDADAAPNKRYALFQCRGDLSQDNCGLCVYDAVERVNNLCTPNEGAVVWYEECMIRYAYHNIFSLSDTDLPYDIWYFGDFSNKADYVRVVPKCMDGVIKDAVHNGSHFATREMNFSASQQVHCLAQCTPDLDEIQCQTCLDAASSNISQLSNTQEISFKAMALFPSCQLRYQNQSFSQEEKSSTPPPPPPSLLPPSDHQALHPSEKKRSIKPTIIVGIASGAFFGLALLVAGLWLCLRRKKVENSSEQVLEKIESTKDGAIDVMAMDDIRNLESLQFDFAGVVAATSNFSDENKLGQGGFGEVYKGKFSNGEEIAVKRLSKNSQQGVIEFKNEVLLLAKLQHRNLVKLLGFCISGEEKILIYEFLSNLSLDRFLYDPLKRASLEWELRFRIITGIARGLLYLHEDSRLKIIHRDLKASNILLDDAMNAKIADFGIARLFNLDQTQGDTMRIAGTYGYMAPEYALAGHFSVKSDVYSFGVLVLEIVSGKKNTFFNQQVEEGLIYRAWRLWKEDRVLELLDPLLCNNFVEEEVKLCIQIGLLCIQEEAMLRPRMASTVSALNGQSITLPSPNAPHFFNIAAATDTTSSNIESQPQNDIQLGMTNDDSNPAYTGAMNITDLHPR